jgi:uncharacterized protein (DUF983 family)
MLLSTRPRPIAGRLSRAPKASGEPATAARPRTSPCSNGHDRALYECSCGYAFDAVVSTSVRCPHCGTAQAW